MNWEKKLCKRILPFQTAVIEIKWGDLKGHKNRFDGLW